MIYSGNGGDDDNIFFCYYLFVYVFFMLVLRRFWDFYIWGLGGGVSIDMRKLDFEG